MTNAADDFANLPSELATKHAELLKAMVQPKDPKEWTDGTNFEYAYAPEAIATILIPVFHSHLRPKRFAFLWKEEMARRGSTVLGKAATASGQVKFFGEVDYVLVFNWVAWGQLTPRQRVALVDHELLHCAVDPENDKPKLRGHDVEEFRDIIERWGLWKPDLKEFGDAVIECTQGDLFGSDRAEETVETHAGKKLDNIMGGVLDAVERGAMKSRKGTRTTITHGDRTVEVPEA